MSLEFVEGLNVLIGGRGVGKTSVIELLRFGLGISSNTEDSLSHAISVLQSGKLTIEIVVNGNTHVVHRTAKDPNPISDIDFPRAIVFSQREIESLGASPEGRLNLIDSFLPQSVSFESRILPFETQVRSLCTALLELRLETEELKEKIPKLPELKTSEANLKKSQVKFGKENEEIRSAQTKLTKTQEILNQLSIKEQNLTAYIQQKESWVAELERLSDPAIGGINSEAQNSDDDLQKFLSTMQLKFSELVSEIEKTKGKAKLLVKEIRDFAKEKLQSRSKLDDEARKLRTQIETFQEGAGQVARELGIVQEQIAVAQNLEKMVLERQQRHSTIIQSILAAVSSIANARKERFLKRKVIADELNKNLHPNVVIEIVHLAKLEQYTEAFKSTLRGSGLRYNELIPVIVNQIGPEELIDLLVSTGYEAFAEVLDIPIDRASRVLHQLGNSNLGEVLSARIDDDVKFVLRDGASYKPIEDLSIGQRCTVALSVILENTSKVLLVDQPEDHLDNEYIANTLIQSLRRRSDSTQTIVSSHNANIPVLGDANKVICLNSNGRKGFVQCEGSLAEAPIVNAIEGIMEGGKDAFERRAQFYKHENK